MAYYRRLRPSPSGRPIIDGFIRFQKKTTKVETPGTNMKAAQEMTPGDKLRAQLGWDAAFQRMHANGGDKMMYDDRAPNQFDLLEWKW